MIKYKEFFRVKRLKMIFSNHRKLESKDKYSKFKSRHDFKHEHLLPFESSFRQDIYKIRTYGKEYYKINFFELKQINKRHMFFRENRGIINTIKYYNTNCVIFSNSYINKKDFFLKRTFNFKVLKINDDFSAIIKDECDFFDVGLYRKIEQSLKNDDVSTILATNNEGISITECFIKYCNEKDILLRYECGDLIAIFNKEYYDLINY